MPRYSPIAPVHILHELHRQGDLGNYLLLLAHDVLEHPQEYMDLLFEVREDHNDDVFIILDNGTVERGAPVELHEILDAASIVEPSCVVSPDVIGDALATRKLVMQQGSVIAQDYPLMLIPQGKTKDEIETCIDWMANSFTPNQAPYWGVPRWFANTFGSRQYCVRYMGHFHSERKMHLLGMSKYMRDDWMCCKAPYVMGIDSANPLVLGYNGIEMHDMMEYTHLDRDDYWEQPKLTELMTQNVEWMHHAISEV